MMFRRNALKRRPTDHTRAEAMGLPIEIHGCCACTPVIRTSVLNDLYIFMYLANRTYLLPVQMKQVIGSAEIVPFLAF